MRFRDTVSNDVTCDITQRKVSQLELRFLDKGTTPTKWVVSPNCLAGMGTRYLGCSGFVLDMQSRWSGAVELNLSDDQIHNHLDPSFAML